MAGRSGKLSAAVLRPGSPGAAAARRAWGVGMTLQPAGAPAAQCPQAAPQIPRSPGLLHDTLGGPIPGQRGPHVRHSAVPQKGRRGTSPSGVRGPGAGGSAQSVPLTCAYAMHGHIWMATSQVASVLPRWRETVTEAAATASRPGHQRPLPQPRVLCLGLQGHRGSCIQQRSVQLHASVAA